MNKMTRILSLLLICVLLLSGCAGTAAPETSSRETVQTSGSSEDKASSAAPSEAVTQPASEAQNETASAAESTEAQPAESESEEVQEVVMEEAFLPLGMDDVAELPDLDDHGLEADQEELAQVERTMRAYQHPENCPLVNNAPYFYYYEQLSHSQKILYDTLMMAAEDPSGNNYVAYLTAEHPTSSAFKQDVNVVFYSMLYDHPELYWLYESQRVYWKYSKEKDYSTYVVYFYVEEYPTFKEDVAAFNDAADAFLSDIDMSGSQLDIARRIQDKLIGMVDYDYDLADHNTRFDRGHTAYGALVANSSGKTNHAVCDGYSLAFNYLLQQAGIPSALMIGYAGSDPENVGCHAWSLMNCMGTWMEVDSTWDDFGNTLIHCTRNNSKWLDYWKEIFEDKGSRDLMEHYLFAVSTDTIRNYKAPVKKYKTQDKKYSFTLLSDSVHIRDHELHSGTTRSTITAMAPIAP